MTADQASDLLMFTKWQCALLVTFLVVVAFRYGYYDGK